MARQTGAEQHRAALIAVGERRVADAEPGLWARVARLLALPAKCHAALATDPAGGLVYDVLTGGDVDRRADKILAAEEWTEPHYLAGATTCLREVMRTLEATDTFRGRRGLTPRAKFVSGEIGAMYRASVRDEHSVILIMNPSEEEGAGHVITPVGAPRASEELMPQVMVMIEPTVDLSWERCGLVVGLRAEGYVGPDFMVAVTPIPRTWRSCTTTASSESASISGASSRCSPWSGSTMNRLAPGRAGPYSGRSCSRVAPRRTEDGRAN